MQSPRFLLPAVAVISLGLALGTASIAFADASTTPDTSSATSTAATSTLTLGNVRVSVDADHAVVRWSTNAPADSRVNYGTTTDYGSTTFDTSMTTTHAVAIDNLALGQTYHFKVVSSDGTNRAVSSDNTFTTATSSGGTGTSTVSTSITNVRAHASDSAASITWRTNQAADSMVQIGTSTDYGIVARDTDMVLNHVVRVQGLAAGTLYHYRVISNNDNGRSVSADYTVTTASSTGGGTGTTTPATTISGIHVSAIGSTTATINWSTDQAADTQVSYGTTTAYGSTSTLDSTASTTHSVMLSDLAAGTTYHFMVMSNNANGMSTSSDQTFMTATSSGGTVTGTSTTPLSINGITTDKGTATPDGSFSDGWQWTFHFTVPTDETQFALKFSDFTNSSSTIPAASNIRYYSAQSSNATSSDSAITITNADTYPTLMLDLTGDTATSTDGRQVDVIVQMAVPAGTASGSYSASWNAESTSTATSTNP